MQSKVEKIEVDQMSIISSDELCSVDMTSGIQLK